VRLTWGRTVTLRCADASAHFIESVIANGIILEQAAHGTDRFGYPVTPTDDDPVRERLGEGPGLVLDDVLTCPVDGSPAMLSDQVGPIPVVMLLESGNGRKHVLTGHWLDGDGFLTKSAGSGGVDRSVSPEGMATHACSPGRTPYTAHGPRHGGGSHTFGRAR
jgi:hypothetical protein